MNKGDLLRIALHKDLEKTQENVDEKADKKDIPKHLDDLNVSENWKAPAGQVVQGLQDHKADKEDLSRSSTIVIANYDSHENSKASADIVIEKGEDATQKINDAIQSLKGVGGEIKLMEGHYIFNSSLIIDINNITLKGVGNSTILKPEELSSNSNALLLIGNKENRDSINTEGVCIKDIHFSSKSRKFVAISMYGASSALQNIEISSFSRGIILNGVTELNVSSANIYNCTNGILEQDNSKLTCVNSVFVNNKYALRPINNSVANLSGLVFRENEEALSAFEGWYSAESVKLLVSHCVFERNIGGAMTLHSDKSGVKISNCIFEDNFIPDDDPEDYIYKGAIIIAEKSKNIMISDCQFISNVQKGYGISLEGEKHIFRDNQFLGSFTSKINDKSKNSTLIGNIGI